MARLNVRDIFVHDRLTHKTARVSIGTNGEQSTVASEYPAFSADGRFVAFGGSDLIPGGNYLYLHDRLTQQNTLISVRPDGLPSGGGGLHPSISANGRYVSFMSSASDLVPEITTVPNTWNVFTYDRMSGKTTIDSVDSKGSLGDRGLIQGTYWNYFPSISADGRLVVFSSYVGLVDGDTNSGPDIFVRDRTFRSDYQGDLQIETTQQPATLAKGSQGSYTNPNKLTY